MSVEPREGSRRRRWLRRVAGAAVLLILLALGAGFFSPQLLWVDSGAAKGDYIVVLGGGGFDRAHRAVDLFKQGRAPKIIVFKKKRRKQYKRKQGHRQGYTTITIDSIGEGSEK